jgi:hypothetical protein
MTLADKLGRPKQSTLAMPICANLHQVREKKSSSQFDRLCQTQGKGEGWGGEKVFLNALFTTRNVSEGTALFEPLLPR